MLSSTDYTRSVRQLPFRDLPLLKRPAVITFSYGCARVIFVIEYMRTCSTVDREKY